MDKDVIERCMTKAILSLIGDNEGIIVKDIDNTKYIISSAYPEKSDTIKIEQITGNDDCIVQNLKEGQMVYLEK